MALIQNGTVNELFVERAAKRGLVGNVYKGKVVRVLPGMQAAFVDIGLSRTAFYTSMIWCGQKPTNTKCLRTSATRSNFDGSGHERHVRNERGSFKYRPSIPSRYLVLMPFGHHIGVSQRIESEVERDRLRSMIERIQTQHKLPGSVIVRTAAEGIEEEAIAQDMAYLAKLWEYIQSRQRKAWLYLHSFLKNCHYHSV